MQLELLSFICLFLLSSVSAIPRLTHPKRTENGIHFPIQMNARRSSELPRRAGLTGMVGLGDFYDVTYSFLVNVGGVETPLVIDTGSSDLWILSDACTTCETELELFPQTTLAESGLDVELLYGDSRTGTRAAGIIGSDTLIFAGISIPNQLFGAINDTTTRVLETNCTGIFGLGFALNSVIWNKVLAAKFAASPSRRRDTFPRRISSPNYGTRFFPDLTHLVSTSSRKRLAPEDLTAAIFASYSGQGPALTRMVSTLKTPMFSVALQRDVLDIGSGNAGILSMGELPAGIDPESLTWVPIRMYPDALTPPADSPNEKYPIAWELFIDDVFFDGVVLPRSNLSSPNIKLSALVDTGNSLIRGPADVLNAIYQRLGGRTFACSTPHTLSFQIGGKIFPVDARDFATQAFSNQLRDCAANLFETDPPELDKGYQYSWSLGQPFLKGVLSSFFFGNLTHPSVLPPRIGLLSTVPADDGPLLKTAIASGIAANSGNQFSTFDPAPTGVPAFSGTGIPTADGVVGKLEGNAKATGGAESLRDSFALSMFAAALLFCIAV
ncbi:Peptidase A1 domain-containing protein [Mycena kentingensis (nom. inval.)]|nr:Peptidase A1 domain-containing protein [Mycena kentingensis (nom. inval.)]